MFGKEWHFLSHIFPIYADPSFPPRVSFSLLAVLLIPLSLPFLLANVVSSLSHFLLLSLSRILSYSYIFSSPISSFMLSLSSNSSFTLRSSALQLRREDGWEGVTAFDGVAWEGAGDSHYLPPSLSPCLLGE